LNRCFISAPTAALLVSLNGCGIGTAVVSTAASVLPAALSPPTQPAPRTAGLRATQGPQSTAGQMCAVSVDRGGRLPAQCAHCAP
jgi:hypothetical protein